MLASRVVILALLLGFGAIVYVALRDRADAGKGMPPFSVYSNERDGLATAAGVLRKLGWQPIALTQPIQHTHYRGLLILVEPRATGLLAGNIADLSAADSKGLLAWVARGNTLLLCGRQQTDVHDALGVVLKPDPEGAKEEELHQAEPGEAGGYTDRIERLEVEGKDSMRAAAGLPLWWVEGQPGAVLVRHGAGRVLVVPDPSLLTHRGLLRQDNVLFLHNVAALDARPGRVYFDEYHHGLPSGGGAWGYLRYHDQQGSALQLLLVAAIGIWGVGVRLGPAVPVPRETRADAVAYASAVARIYQRAGVRHVLAGLVVRDFFVRLTKPLHLRATASPEQILAAWRKRHPDESAKRLEELLRGTAELRRTASESAALSEHQLLTLTQALDDFRLPSGGRQPPERGATQGANAPRSGCAGE